MITIELWSVIFEDELLESIVDLLLLLFPTLLTVVIDLILLPIELLIGIVFFVILLVVKIKNYKQERRKEK